MAKAGAGVIVGLILLASASFASVESGIAAGILGIAGLITVLYGAYNLRHLDRNNY